MKLSKTLAFAALIAWSGWMGAEAKETKDVFLFPFAKPASAQVSEEFNLENEVQNALYARLKSIKGVNVERFRASHPSMQRAVMENRLRRDRMQPPFNVKEADGNWLCVKIAREAGMEYALAGSIEEYTFNAADQQVVLTVSLDLIQVSDGQILFTSAETGRARSRDETPNQNLLAVNAISDVVKKLGDGLEQRLAPASDTEQKEPEKKSRNNTGIFVGAAFLILLSARLASQNR